MQLRTTFTRSARKLLIGTGLVIAGSMLSGCIQMDQRFDVQADGSIRADILIAIDKEQFGALASLGEGVTETTIKGKKTATTKPADLCADLVTDTKKGVEKGATVLPYKSGKFCGARIRQTYPAGSDLKAKLNATLDSAGSATDSTGTGSTSDPFFDTLSLKKVGSGWVLDGRVGAVQDATADPSEVELAKTFFKDAKITVRFKLPGKVSTHNATSVESDGTLVWTVDLLSTKPTLIKAKSA